MLPPTVDIVIRAIRQSYPGATTDEVVDFLIGRGWNFPVSELRARVVRLGEVDGDPLNGVATADEQARQRDVSPADPPTSPSDVAPPISKSAIYLQRERKRIRRVMGALLDLLKSPRPHRVLLKLDDAGLRIQIEARDPEFRVVIVSMLGEPALDTFRCDCHRGMHPGAETAKLLAFPGSSEVLLLGCAQAVVRGVEQVCLRAVDREPGAQTEVWVNGRDDAAVRLREAEGLIRYQRLSDGSRRVASRLQSRGRALARFDRPLGEPVDHPDPRDATRSDTARTRRRWAGFAPSPACRAVTARLLASIGEGSVASDAELAQMIAREPCRWHIDPVNERHICSSRWFQRVDSGGLSLSQAGREERDRLLIASRPFRSHDDSSLLPLHAWQEEALASWAEHGRIGVIEAVTGTGKSRLGIEAILEARDTMPAVVCVPTLVLVDQWVRNLHRHGIAEVGVVGGGVHDTFKSHRVLVGTVQTLARTPVLLDEPGEALLVADECHRYGAGSFQEALDHRYVRRLGLTATFERSDDAIQDLMTFFGGRPAFEIGYDRAVGDGVVSRYVVATLGVEFAASERTEYDEVASTCSEYRAQLIELGLPPAPFGDFMEAVGAAAKLDSTFLGACAGIYLEAFSRRAEILSDAAAKATAVAALAPSVRGGGGALFFARHVATAEKVESILRGSGVTAAALHGQSPSRLRRRVLAEFRRRRLQAVAAPQILDEGVDVPDADLAVIVGTTQSRRQMIQRMGRVLRLKPDGRRARFVLLYVRGTSEDPILSGAHEAFFDMISGTADAVQHFSHQEVGALNEFLMSH